LNKFGKVDCNPLSTSMEQNLKLTSSEENKFKDATKYRQLEDFNTKYHMILEAIQLIHCSTNEQIVDIFAKELGRAKFEKFDIVVKFIFVRDSKLKSQRKKPNQEN